MPFIAFVRTWIVSIVGCLPLLILLLIPELMRSRAGSEQLLIVGSLTLLVLLAAAFVFAPLMSAIAAPVTGRWTPRSALRRTRAVWSSRRGQAWLAVGGALLVYGAAQAVGYWVGAIAPSVRDNPAFGSGGSDARWIIDYPAYVLQAATIYAITTLAIASYGWRIRVICLTALTAAPADVRTGELAA
ncbi:hypothetical protein [Microbacterium hibisci]|uniref:hypothetical protein n=1 Tax=Microbacterium hibisci TaxID=2036000 RepID=UPI001945A307|nr:hypothetical protein [Microbacterium hibisci]